MTMPRMSRRLFLLVSVLILCAELGGVVLAIHLLLGWRTTWYLDISAARGDAAMWVLALFAVMFVMRIVTAMLRLKDAGVSVWFALAYGVPLLLVALFDAMTFALVTPETTLTNPVIFRMGAFVCWLAILLVPAAGHGFWSAGPRRQAAGPGAAGRGHAPVGQPGSPATPVARSRQRPPATERPGKAFGKRLS